jgi:hypothetical protein
MKLLQPGMLRWVSDAYTLLGKRLVKQENVICPHCFHSLENINSVILASTEKRYPSVSEILRKRRNNEEEPHSAAIEPEGPDAGVYMSGESELIPTEVVESDN